MPSENHRNRGHVGGVAGPPARGQLYDVGDTFEVDGETFEMVRFILRNLDTDELRFIARPLALAQFNSLRVQRCSDFQPGASEDATHIDGLPAWVQVIPSMDLRNDHTVAQRETAYVTAWASVRIQVSPDTRASFSVSAQRT